METHHTVSTRKRPGPPKRGYAHAHILLPPELLEWAKHQPEGLSGLVRHLLAHAKAHRTSLPSVASS